MKTISYLVLSTLFTSGLTFAQTEKDFGGLIYGGLWEITNQGTNPVKSITELNGVKSKDGIGANDDIEYTTNSTPKRTLFRKWQDQRLVVLRENSKIKRISQLSYEFDPSSEKRIVTYAINGEGKVESRSYCDQSYSTGMFGALRTKGSTRCRTINPQVCEYVESNKLKEAFNEDLSKCSDVIAKIVEHQQALAKISEKDAVENTKHLQELDKKTSEGTDLYKYPTIALKDAGSVAIGFDELVSDCEELKQAGYLAEVSSEKGAMKLEKKKKGKTK